jgi:hypothetical protein
MEETLNKILEHERDIGNILGLKIARGDGRIINS